MQDDIQIDHPKLKVVISFIIIGFILSAIVSFSTFQQFNKLQLLLGEFIIIVPALIYVKSRPFNFLSVFRLKPVNRSVLLSSTLFSLGFLVIIDELDRLINKFIQMPPEWEELLNFMLKANNFSEWIILILAAVILAGVVEEMLFRGLLQKALEYRFDIIRAIFFSALAFAFFHPAPWIMQVLLLGLILGFLSWRSDSILPGIILHALNNGYSLLRINIDEKYFKWYEWHNHVNPTILVISIAVSYYSIKWFYNSTDTISPIHQNFEES